MGNKLKEALWDVVQEYALAALLTPKGREDVEPLKEQFAEEIIDTMRSYDFVHKNECREVLADQGPRWR